jgi:hypothetical protein
MKQGRGRGDDNDKEHEQGGEDKGQQWQGQDELGDTNSASEDED